MCESVQLSTTVPFEFAGQRLDQVLARLFPDYSRSRFQGWIKQGAVSLDGRQPRPRDKVLGGEAVRIDARVEPDSRVEPEPLALSVVYEDDAVLVIDKPAGLVVHPGAGNRSGTVQNALLHHEPALAGVPRAGIVHRLDKDTTGLMVVAKTLTAHKSLVDQLAARTVQREYMAVVVGRFTAGGTIEAPIGRHPVDRKRMAVVGSGRPAVTHYRVAERFSGHTLLRVFLETGRTHQIRVHMAHRRHPLVGDAVYGGRPVFPKQATEAVRDALQSFGRQALHARRLTFEHPVTRDAMTHEAPLPDDLDALVGALRAHAQEVAVE